MNNKLYDAINEYKDVTVILLLDNLTKEKNDYILKKCDGFIVPGGTSWSDFDEYVISYAVDSQKPLLAICAGFQALCSMYAVNRDRQDMTKNLDNDSHYGKQNEYIHKNKIIDNTLLSKMLNDEEILVNSLHHSYIDIKLSKLIVSAVSEDNILEAVELPEHQFLVGVQWHPEYLMDNNSIKIFDYFINTIKT